jgi:DNA-binding MarR family transcriptional regulator
MYKNLMYICFQMRVLWPRNDKKMKNSQLYKGSLNTIIMKLLENGKMYVWNYSKVKAITGELNITEGRFVSRLHKLEAEGILDVEIEKVDNRMRKYYKLTEAGTKKPWTDSRNWKILCNMQSLVNPKPNLEF